MAEHATHRSVNSPTESPPTVTVLMAVHDGERFLREAMGSVLAQTYDDFEFVVVDDASTDGTRGILAACPDPRLRVVRNEANLGLTRSLNRGLALARGRYVARLDADDANEPERLARQVARLDASPGVSILGTWTTEVDEHGAVIGGETMDPDPGFVRWLMTHRNAVYHSSVLMRRDVVLDLGGYDERLRYAQDHDLWTRAIMAGGDVTLVPERLTRYRRTSDQITRSKLQQQLAFGLVVRRRYCEWILKRPVPESHVSGMMWLIGWDLFPPPADAAASLQLLQRLRTTCQRTASRDAARRIEVELRHSLLSTAARRLADDVQSSRRLTWSALRTGRGSLRDGALWRQAARLARASLRGRSGRARVRSTTGA